VHEARICDEGQRKYGLFLMPEVSATDTRP
jgi:hypothetical protein